MSEEEQLLQAGWVYTTIGDVTYKKVDQIERSCPLTYIDIGSVDNLSKSIKDPNQLTQADKVPSRARQVVATNDVLVSMTRPNLNAVTIVPQQFENSIASTGFDVLRAIEVEPRWLFNIVKSNHFIESMSQIVQGALYPAVRPSDIRGYKIPLPPLNEQRRIVAKIEQLQERSRKAREALAEVGSLLEQFRQSLLAAAFRGDLTADWRAANPNVEPASELLNRIRQERRQKWEEAELSKYESKGKQPPMGWMGNYQSPVPLDESGAPKLPDSWCWVQMVELPSEEPNSLTIGPFGSNLKVKDYTTAGVPLVFVREIRAESFGDEKTKYVSKSKAKELTAHQVRGGDLLITKMGDPPGDTAIYPVGLPNAVITADCIRLAPSDKLTSALFLKYWLRAEPAREKILEETKGVAQRKLSLKRFRELTLPLPPLSEQSEIIRLIEATFKPLFDVAAMVAESESELTELDQSILSKAFRGELVPQDRADEPASVLLERIREAREKQHKNKPVTKTANERPEMHQNVGEKLKEWLSVAGEESFTFDDLRREVSGDYDELRDAVYRLLDQTTDVEQIFDESTGAMCFRRRVK